MTKKHIISFGLYDYALDSITAATQTMAVLAKLRPVRYKSDGNGNYAYEPATDEDIPRNQPKLEMNQPYREARKPKAEKPLALPTPKRGSILCICEKSYVAPKQSCPHCGRPFSESHNRTHGDQSDSQPKLRLI